MSKELTTRAVTAELALRLMTSRCTGAGRRILEDRRAVADDLVFAALSPYAPAGLYSWYVRSKTRETAKGYARRAVRCLVARAADAGVSCELSHAGAETVGLAAKHGARPRRAVDTVSRLERVSQSLNTEVA